MDWFMIPLNCAIIFGCIYKVVELFVHKRERLMLISKLSEISNVDFKGISLYSSSGKFTALRIGYLLVGVGIGFLLGFLLNLWVTLGKYADTADWPWHHYNDNVGGIVYVACVCICGGIGLLLSYKAEYRAEHPEEKRKEEF